MQAQRILLETWRKGKRYGEAMHVVKGDFVSLIAQL